MYRLPCRDHVRAPCELGAADGQHVAWTTDNRHLYWVVREALELSGYEADRLCHFSNTIDGLWLLAAEFTNSEITREGWSPSLPAQQSGSCA